MIDRVSNFLISICLGLVLAAPFAVAATDEVNVYSYRKPQLIDPLFEAFTQQTGIRVNSVFAKKGLLQRLKSEGRNSPADLVFTTDIGRLTDIQRAGLTQSVDSPTLRAAVPANYREPQGHWFGLTARARIIVVSKGRVTPGEIEDYEDLVDPLWQGRVCTRSAKHPYMVALTASMIAAHGYAHAKQWLDGLRNNLARRPQGNDRAQVKAIYNGLCDVAVINHYYMAKMLADPKQKSWAESVRVIFPNQSGRGTHMNVSGVALTKHAPHRDSAIVLMEFLASEQGQALYAKENGEYPVTSGVPWNALQQSWGKFRQDSLSLATIADHRARAVRLADEVGYDD
ncbi:MAG: Fe(3+) ABC transporter substrate-binding protein [Arenicellales bacterium]|jgi:iron(III) transport system substrate-binding protein|nr:Fe(3+) ABC transporter substrate-binding protein [Arenicellales bacterium]MDP6291484.1 Fe(3+) ABC transporter substrate-binding protein [Arenicellales bacterium]MDP7569203.1 Fe(3+) ABC transporter substrate-binding protein [Arenicellales bacterium]HJL56756.1 Fe(3+) ABC transporter substrate-binding protein [Arenicellales bacterium]|tara:strand:- start:698 stop:1723 length:1026 start_codon:yes stop_codon:yes gene_type:complete